MKDQRILNSLRIALREVKNNLYNSNKNSAISSLQQIKFLLDIKQGYTHPQTQYYSELFQIQPSDFFLAKEYFLELFYGDFLDFIINWLNTNKELTNSSIEASNLFNSFFLNTENAIQPFLALVEGIHQEKTNKINFKISKCIYLLEKLLEKHILLEIFLYYSTQPAKNKLYSSQVQIEQTYHLISKIPDIVTAKCENNVGKIFYPEAFIQLLVKDFLNCLNNVYLCLKSQLDCSLVFLANCIGSICSNGYSDLFWKSFLPSVSSFLITSEDLIWSRICEKLFSQIPDSSIEGSVLSILKYSKSYSTVAHFFSQSIITSSKMNYILTKKLFLSKYFSELIIPKNVIGYLISCSKRRHLLDKTFISVLEVWSSSSYLHYASTEQHLYITKVLLIMCGAFRSDIYNQSGGFFDSQQLKQDALGHVAYGIQNHLNSNNNQIALLGQILAEQLTLIFSPSDEIKLKFDYKTDKFTHDLQLLAQSSFFDSSDNINLSEQLGSVKLSDKEETTHSDSRKKSLKSENFDSDDDIDDSFIDDSSFPNKTRTPLYIRDCIEGLMSSDNPDLVEVCLNSAIDLIHAHPQHTKEVVLEFSQIVLHLQDNYNIKNFASIRQNIMIELVLSSPKEAAEYYGNEFYAQNYNIRQRLDILQVLSASAQRLSEPEKPEMNKEKSSKINSCVDCNNIQSVIKARLESKTRRWGKSQDKFKQSKPNSFGLVAGSFFFPLLAKFSNNETSLDFLGRDHLLLARLIQTLGIILYSSINTLIIRNMTAALFDFVLQLKYHDEGSVRKAILFSISAIAISTPANLLTTDFLNEVENTRTWLQDIASNDSDNECRKLAVQSFSLLRSQILKNTPVLEDQYLP